MSSIIKKSFEERARISKSYIDNNKDIIPIILTNNINENNKKKWKLTKTKYLTKRSYYLTFFMIKIKEINKIEEDTTFIMKSKNIIINNSLKMGEIYDKYKNKDGFWYLDLDFVSSFG